MQLTLPHNGYKVPQKVAVVQRFKEESMYGLSTPKKWPYVEKPAQQTSYYTKVGGRVKKIERGGGREKLIQKIFPAKPVSRSRKILSFCFRSIVFFFLYTCCFFAERSSMGSLLHNVHYILCGKRKTFPATIAHQPCDIFKSRQVKILFTYIVVESEAFI